jgi:hypothetical protein
MSCRQPSGSHGGDGGGPGRRRNPGFQIGVQNRPLPTHRYAPAANSPRRCGARDLGDTSGAPSETASWQAELPDGIGERHGDDGSWFGRGKSARFPQIWQPVGVPTWSDGTGVELSDHFA